MHHTRLCPPKAKRQHGGHILYTFVHAIVYYVVHGNLQASAYPADSGYAQRILASTLCRLTHKERPRGPDPLSIFRQIIPFEPPSKRKRKRQHNGPRASKGSIHHRQTPPSNCRLHRRRRKNIIRGMVNTQPHQRDAIISVFMATGSAYSTVVLSLQ